MRILKYTTLVLLVFFQCAGFSLTTSIKIMSYNTSDKDGNVWTATSPTRVANLRGVISAENPDIIAAVEINNDNTDAFLTNVLNYDSPTYSKGTFIANDGSISPNSICLYYKTSEFNSASFNNTIIPSYLDTTQTTRFRDINKFTITHNGGETIVIYAVHLKPAGGAANHEARAAEISYLLNYISDNAPTSTSENYIVLGDFNTNRSDEGAYMNLLYYPSLGLNGYFYDPQQTDPPSHFGDWTSFWSTSKSYSSTSRLERFDMILMSENVWNGNNGIHFSGNYTVVGNPTPSADDTLASNHLPVYATFDFNDAANPVELSFFAGVLNGDHIDLRWRTETEVNNYGFEIERTKDNLEWLKIGFVEGHGNSNSVKYYNYTDRDIHKSGTYKYRLKQLDNDGTYEYSDVVSVEVRVPGNFYLSQNYPNPFNPSTRIEFTIPEKQMVSLSIYNTLGELVTELVNEIKEAGSYSVTFDGSSVSNKLDSGVYFYRIETPTFANSNKMILLK